MPLTDREKELFALARGYIAEGRLPRKVPPSVGAGSGSRETCNLCGATIEPEDVEYEFLGDTDAGVRFRFHIRCHSIWQLAATSRATGNQPAGPAAADTAR